MICLVAALVLSSTFAAPGQAPHSDILPTASRTPAPDFTLTGVDGKSIALSHEKGRVVLLDFWATTCGGCKIEIPWYVDFDSRYRTHGLSTIGLDMYAETPEIIRPFMDKWKMNYPVAVGTDALGDRYHLTDMPLTLLIDRQGRIAVSHAGIVDRATFEAEIQLLLAE